jgi:hypothetical protein
VKHRRVCLHADLSTRAESRGCVQPVALSVRPREPDGDSSGSRARLAQVARVVVHRARLPRSHDIFRGFPANMAAGRRRHGCASSASEAASDLMRLVSKRRPELTCESRFRPPGSEGSPTGGSTRSWPSFRSWPSNSTSLAPVPTAHHPRGLRLGPAPPIAHREVASQADEEVERIVARGLGSLHRNPNLAHFPACGAIGRTAEMGPRRSIRGDDGGRNYRRARLCGTGREPAGRRPASLGRRRKNEIGRSACSSRSMERNERAATSRASWAVGPQSPSRPAGCPGPCRRTSPSR